MFDLNTSTPFTKAPQALGRLATVALATLVLLAAGSAQAQLDPSAGPCGNPFQNHFGPFDYRSAAKSDVKLVENVHFTPGVQSLTRPGTTTFERMAGDVGYTLHVFPNHHRALVVMGRLAERHKMDQPPGASYTLECYFHRAVRFRPDDTVARALYAQFLGKKGRKPEAVAQLKVADEFAKDNPLSHFNIGLLFMELGEFDLALTQAHKVKALGYDRPQLEQALRQAGKWRDPTP